MRSCRARSGATEGSASAPAPHADVSTGGPAVAQGRARAPRRREMRVVRQNCLAFGCFLLPLLWDAQAHTQGTCEPVGDVRFVCMSHRTEDIVSVPNSDWVLTSGVLTATHTRTGV